MADVAFLKVLRASHLSSYCITDSAQHLLAFGQHYLRLGRHHLGRLAVNPNYRNQGLAKVLIAGLLEQAGNKSQSGEASLFVFRDNLAALHCYQSIGFREEAYPEVMPENMPNCVYMVLR
jgi:ribosomal protein S18 acetylase RimI-like enzyme